MSDTLSSTEEGKLIDEIREEFKFSDEGEGPQRQRELDDLQFQVPELQWDEAAAASRLGSNENGVTVLPKPMLSISKVDQPVRLVMNQAFSAKLGINIHPVSEKAEAETAETLADLIRRIERDSDANSHRMWALDRAVKAGRGVYEIVVRPDEDGFNYGDLEIGISRILHGSSVRWDPSAQLPDWSDGDFAYKTSWMLLSKAARTYKGRRAMEASTSGIPWSNMSEEAPLWTRTSGAGKSIQVAERFWKKHREEKVLILTNGKAIRDGVDKMPAKAKVHAEIVRDCVEVWHVVTDGFNILEQPKRWFGKYIPLIPVLGRELQPFDEQRRIIGIIRNARDPQRFYNSSVSTLMEVMFSEPRTPWVMAEGQDEGREAQWANANYLSIPVLKYKPTTLKDGTAAPPPMRTPRDSTAMSIALESVQIAGVVCQETTAFFDPSLGKGAGGQQESGRKVLALQGQGDAANSDWLQNLAVAMRYEGLQLVDLIAPADKARPGVYDAPGRIATVLGGEPEKERKVMFNRPSVVDEKTGLPRAARRGEQKGVKHFDLRSGARYGVSIDIGTSFKTRLQEGDEAITRMIEADPTLLSVVGDLLFTFKDIPGAKQISERLLMLVQGQHPEFFQKDDSPEAAQMKARALGQQVQVLSKQLQEAVQFVQTDQAKHQAQIQIEQFKAQASVHIQEMKDATSIAVAQINAQVKGLQVLTEAQNEQRATGLKMVHEERELAKDRLHEREIGHEKQAHEVAMEVARGDGATRHTEQGHETGQEHEQETGQGTSKESTQSAETQPAAEGEA